MNSIRYIRASLRHHRRIHVAVALGVAVATAVLTGALLVGDSVRGSLRDLTLQRLGRVDSAVVAPHLFRAALADELAADTEFQAHFADAEPALLMSGTLQSGSGDDQRRATDISVVGCRETFWSLGQGGPPEPLGDEQIALTATIARELGAAAGDEVLLRIPIAGAVPADSPLGEKSDTSQARRLRVAAVLPAAGLARFGIVPSQHSPRNVFVPLATLQKLLERPGRANTLLVATGQPHRVASEAARRALAQAFRPRLQDYGVRVERIDAPTDYVQISADQLVLPDAVVRAAARAFGEDELQPVITYLANTLVVGDGDARRKIPYSTMTGIDSVARVGPLLDEAGRPIVLADDEIALNRWAADDLQVEVGDLLTVTFYEPESAHGQLREHQPPPTFTLRAIVDLETEDGRPTAAADPHLTPELPGVTDQASINDWDLPFELVETIRPEDEDYWDEHRTTPKAFVSLATAQRLWPSRWGTISLLRLPVDESLQDASASVGETRRHVSDRLAAEIKPSELGMTFLPVKQMGLQASSGTTSFSMLFLGFSFFLIAAAVMLIALLFQLGIQQRGGELGTLAAVGLGKKRIAWLLSREGLVVAAVGALVGVALGVVYAWAMVSGLRTWWVAAIGTPFLELHVTWPSLAIGFFIGLAASWLTIRVAIARLVRRPAARLLAGAAAGESRSPDGQRAGRLVWPTLRLALLLLTAALIVAGFRLQGEAQAGVFFASGAAVLVLLLGEVRHASRRVRRRGAGRSGFSLWRLSALNTARHPGRSTLTIGLVAAASFLIVAISAFRLETGEAGTGGFEILATSDLPIHYDLNTPEGRLELGFSDRPRANQVVSDEELLREWRVYSLRTAGGEDASCLNLYRPRQPRVLGVPEALVERGGFEWQSTYRPLENEQASHLRDYADGNPWRLLEVPLDEDENQRRMVPVVLDANTATYSLKIGVGSQCTIRDGADRPVTLLVVGLLKNSVLQGNLLVSEANFLRLFPDTGGYKFFLMERTAGPASRGRQDSSAPLEARQVQADGTRSVPAALETALADFGFDAVDAREQLAAFLAVQNTYLSTFQSLGTLGLLLGTVGLAAVQLRSVLERRGELALLRAGGFQRSRLVRMVVWENGVLLLGGLVVGCVAAMVALIPQWAPQDADVPWRTLAVLLATIAVVGLAAGWLATRAALRAAILPALRGD